MRLILYIPIPGLSCTTLCLLAAHHSIYAVGALFFLAYIMKRSINLNYQEIPFQQLNIVTRKPVRPGRTQQVCSATEISLSLEMSDIEAKEIILSRQQKKKEGAHQSAW